MASEKNQLPSLPNLRADPKIFRPLKVAISLRLDADVLAWFKSQGAGYQARMNAVLREAMQQEPNK